MTFQQKNNTVSLASFSLLLIFFLLRIAQLVRNQNFNDATVVRLWIIVVVLAIVSDRSRDHTYARHPCRCQNGTNRRS